MRQHEGDIRRRDSADAAGLGQRNGTNVRELFAGLESQMANSRVVEAVGNPLVGQSLLAGDLLLLPRYITFIFQITGHLPRRVARDLGEPRVVSDDVRPLRFRAAEELLKRRSAGSRRAQ